MTGRGDDGDGASKTTAAIASNIEYHGHGYDDHLGGHRRATRIAELGRILGVAVHLVEVVTVTELVTAIRAPDVAAVALDARHAGVGVYSGSPWPWVVVGIALLGVGVATFSIRQLQRTYIL